MNISELIQDCQVHLYDRLHLKNRFRLRAVCRSLNESFSVHSATIHFLVLKLGPNEKATEPNDLVCSTLNREIGDFLLATFFSITNLTIRLDRQNPDLLEQIAYLLKGWSNSLQSLKLDLDFQIDQNSRFNQNIETLFSSINELASLKCLHFQCTNKLPNTPLDLSILGKLEEFQFDAKIALRNIYKALTKHAMVNDNLRIICLNQIKYEADDDTLNDLLQLDGTFLRKFTSFGKELYLTDTELHRFHLKLTSLTYLCVWVKSADKLLAFQRVTSLLALNMPQLKKLTIHLNLRYQNALQEALPLTPLPSITSLDLKLAVCTHNDLAKYINPAHTFPAVQEVKFHLMLLSCCSICDIWNALQMNRKCQQYLVQPFSGCQQLCGPVMEGEISQLI